MIAKTQFKKEQIVEAGFEIACEEGLERITVRKVAERLGSSIAPIYVNFQTIDDLVQAVVEKTIKISQRLLAEQDTGNPFYDIGAASLRFAREYPQLFRELALKPNPYLQNYRQGMDPILLEQMRQDTQLSGLNDAELEDILLKMRVFSLGLSAMIANGMLPESFDAERAAQFQDSVANDVIAGARERKPAGD